MIIYNGAFNSARLVPAAHKYISDWKKNAENFRNAMLEEGKAEIDFEYSDEKDCKMDIFTPVPMQKRQ